MTFCNKRLLEKKLGMDNERKVADFMGKIIAIGGGYNGGDFDSLLEEKVRSFIPNEQPHVAFIPYASTDFEENYNEFQTIYNLLGCQVSLLQPGNESLLLQSDLIYLGRGWTIPLLEKLA